VCVCGGGGSHGRTGVSMTRAVRAVRVKRLLRVEGVGQGGGVYV